MAKFKLQYSFEFYANLRELIGIGYDDPRKKKQNKTKQEEGKKRDLLMHFAFTGYEKMAIQILVRHTAGKILCPVHFGKKFRLIFSEIFFSGSVQ